MAIPTPDATELAAAFDLGTPVTPPERIASGWGGHNHLWRLTTSRGTWAIKEVGRDLSLDPDDTLALELAAYTGGRVPMPRPVPTVRGRCLVTLNGRRYGCHEWLDGTSLSFAGTVSVRLPAYEPELWTTDMRLGILGYAVVPAQQGCGFASEAAASMVQLAFDDMRLHRLRATTLRDSVPSRRVLERFGFRIRYTDVLEVPRYGGPPRLGDTYMLERADWQRSDEASPNATALL